MWQHFKKKSNFFLFLCSRVHHEGIFVQQLGAKSSLRVRSRGCEAVVGFLSRPSTQRHFSYLFSRCFFSRASVRHSLTAIFLFLFVFHFSTSVWLYTFLLFLYRNDVDGNLTKYSACILLFIF